MASSRNTHAKARALPMWQRLFFAVPVLGWIAHDLAFGDKDNVWYALVLVVSLWAISGLTFGVPGIYVPAVAVVPIIFAILLLITWG